ncbi:MAG: SMI1/KNR4 family protein [Pseudomonadota bacterium]|nr:SMI1/KNR4 family protein [Pseudomonadota bacterium]
MHPVHVRLLDHARRALGKATASPEPPDGIAAAEARLGRPLPPGYRRFLEEVGKARWPLRIENVATFEGGPWPEYFVPFASDYGELVYGFDLRGGDGADLPIDFLDFETDELDEDPGPAVPFEDWLAARIDDDVGPAPSAG